MAAVKAPGGTGAGPTAPRGRPRRVDAVAGTVYLAPMADVVVVGAGVGGLGTALALSQGGHRVTVVEQDATDVPDSPDAAFDQWQRRGAPQVRHSHAFLARLRNLLRDRAPEVLEDLLAAGAAELRFTDDLPPGLEDRSPRPGDEDLVAIACRRTTFEWVLRRDALGARGVRLVEGGVVGLLTGPHRPPGAPHVVGVRLAGGSEVTADLVVDASGQRSRLPAWLTEIGTDPVSEREQDTGIVYSSRFYRFLPGAGPPIQGGPLIGDLGYLKYAVFGGDNRTFSITFGLHADDVELRQLLRPGPFSWAAAALPAVRAWVDPDRAEPITGVEVMARLLNRRRRFVRGGRPVATGVFAVGDSHVCTNPLYGRGCSLAMVHAYLLADTLAAHGDDHVTAALAFDQATRDEIDPWYHAAVAQDRQGRDGRTPLVDTGGEGPDVGVEPDSLRSLISDGLLPAARSDPVVFRAFLRAFNLLDPPAAIMQNPDVLGRVLAVWQQRADRPPPPPLGPDRAGMLRILTEAPASPSA